MSRKNPPCDPSSNGCVPESELRLPLRPYPLSPVLCACVLAPLLLLLLLALWQGRLLVVAAGAAIGGALCAALWLETAGNGAARPIALRLDGRGQLALCFTGGVQESVRLGAGSLFIGRGALLVLHGRRRHHLWLGPANLAPAQLAALRRWLARSRSAGPGRNFLY